MVVSRKAGRPMTAPSRTTTPSAGVSPSTPIVATLAGARSSATIPRQARPTWIGGPHRPNQVTDTWAYRYPASRTAWKKNSVVAQTAGVPPKMGSARRPTSGSTVNSRKADRPMGAANANVRAVMQALL